MSLPNIPNIVPEIDLNLTDSLKLLLNSYAMTDISFSHILNAEGEKMQNALGTLNAFDSNEGCCNGSEPYTSQEILEINNSIKSTLRDVLRNQMIMQMKMEDTLIFYDRLVSGASITSKSEIASELQDTIISEGINCDPICF